MEELPGSCIMTEAYRVMTHMILQTAPGTKGPRAHPLLPGGTRDASDGFPPPLPTPRPPGGGEAACLASLLWLVAEQGQRHLDRPAPPLAWMRAVTGRLSLGLDQLHDLPARARPLLQLLVQPGGALHKVWRRNQEEEQRGGSGRGWGGRVGDRRAMQAAPFPHFAVTFLGDFYSALERYLEQQEQAPSERYQPSHPPAASRTANGLGTNGRVLSALNRPDEWRGSGSGPSPLLRPDERQGSGRSGPPPPLRPLPPPAGAVSRLAGNRLRDLCRGLELLPLMMQVGGGREPGREDGSDGWRTP